MSSRAYFCCLFAGCTLLRRSGSSVPAAVRCESAAATPAARCGVWLSGALIGSMRAGGVVEVRLVVLGVCLLQRLLDVAETLSCVAEGDRP